jgi:GAF domain-containing protein
MRRFTVTARGLSSVEVEARNWVVALGHGLAELGREELSRLACEVLPNGTVIARDIASGTGYVVQALDTDEAVDDEPSTADGGVFALSDDDEDLDETIEDHPLRVADDDDDDDDGVDDLAELPLEALQPLDPTDDLRHRIGDAETVLMACHLTLEAAIAAIPSESGAVLLEERGHMRFTAVHGPSSRKLMGVRLPMGTGVAGFALEHGRTIVLSNANEDPRHCGEVDALTGYTTEAIAVVPIQSGANVFGVLELLNPPERFTEDEVAKLKAVADCLAERLDEDAARGTPSTLERR